jgi:hypothetical protein
MNLHVRIRKAEGERQFPKKRGQAAKAKPVQGRRPRLVLQDDGRSNPSYPTHPALTPAICLPRPSDDTWCSRHPRRPLHSHDSLPACSSPAVVACCVIVFHPLQQLQLLDFAAWSTIAASYRELDRVLVLVLVLGHLLNRESFNLNHGLSRGRCSSAAHQIETHSFLQFIQRSKPRRTRALRQRFAHDIELDPALHSSIQPGVSHQLCPSASDQGQESQS